MSEGLDHLEALDHLLDIAVDGAQGLLLLGIVGPALAAHLGEDQQQTHQGEGSDDKQNGAQIEHHGHSGDKGDGGAEQLHHRLLQSHLDVVGVVGEPAHQLAVGMPVEVAQGQLLQAVKQLPAQDIAALLGQLGHEDGLNIGANGGDGIDAHELEDGLEQIGQHRLGIGPDRGSDMVDNRPHEVGACHRGQRCGHHADQGHKEQQRPAGQIGEHPQGGFLQVLGLLHTAPAPSGASMGISHCPSLLPAESSRFPDRSGWWPSARHGYPWRRWCHPPGR